MATKQRRLTDAERQERREQDRQRLQQAAEQLLSSDGWQRWVRVRSRNGISRYSINNQLLIALACPDATFVAGFRAWIELGYAVRKGERAIRILAPMKLKRGDQDGDDEETRVVFKSATVFDRGQVDPIPGVEQAPLEPPCQPLTGDSHEHLLAPLQAFANDLGYSVAFDSVPGSAGGYCDSKAKHIVIDVHAPPNARVRVLVHELAHALGVDYQHYSRQQAEVIVDTVTYIVCAGAGLDVGGESIPYIAGWGEDGALQAVSDFAALIHTLAGRIEAALGQGTDSAAPVAA